MTPTPKPATDRKRKQRSRKARALLAGGLIAGIGIVATLATWNSGVLGDVTVNGSDPEKGAGLLEVFDADGNWASGDKDGAAHLPANVTLPNREEGGDWRRPVYEVPVGKVRLTGVDATTEIRLTGQVGIESDNPDVKAYMIGNLYIASKCDVYEGAYSFAANNANVLEKFDGKPPITHTVTGPLEMNVCFHGILMDHEVEHFGASDSAHVSLDLTATPAS